MRTLAGALLVSLALGCASGADPDAAILASATPPKPATDPRVPEMEKSIGELLERIEVLNARIKKLEEGPDQGAAAIVPVATAAPSQPAARPRVAAPPRGLRGAAVAERYRSALELYGKGAYAESRSAFQAVLEAEPDGDLADNALYWIGETYFASGDFAKAVEFYARVVAEYPEQNKAPDAMLKAGMSQARLGDLALAKRTFEQLIARHPYSTPAAAARQELKRIQY